MKMATRRGTKESKIHNTQLLAAFSLPAVVPRRFKSQTANANATASLSRHPTIMQIMIFGN